MQAISETEYLKKSPESKPKFKLNCKRTTVNTRPVNIWWI